MFLVWQGLGFVVPLIPIVFILLGQFLLDAVMGPGFYHSHGWSMAFMLLLSGVAVWMLGTRLNNKPGRELIDPQTQETVILRKRHTLFWIPFQYFGIIIGVLATLFLFL